MSGSHSCEFLLFPSATIPTHIYLPRRLLIYNSRIHFLGQPEPHRIAGGGGAGSQCNIYWRRPHWLTVWRLFLALPAICCCYYLTAQPVSRSSKQAHTQQLQRVKYKNNQQRERGHFNLLSFVPSSAQPSPTIINPGGYAMATMHSLLAPLHLLRII